MAQSSDPQTLVLHALRLKGFADTDVVAVHAGLSPADAAKLLDSFASQGMAVRREGRITGWSLTPAGRKQHGELIGAEVDAAGCRDAVRTAYRAFLDINGETETAA